VTELLSRAGDAAKGAASASVNRERTAGGLGATVESLQANVVALVEIVGGLTEACRVLAQEVDKSGPAKSVGNGPS
jgi:hypothetical protein